MLWNKEVFIDVHVSESWALEEIVGFVCRYMVFIITFPFCIGRYPNLKSVNDLIYKKGLVKINKQRVPLTDNNIIEQVLETPTSLTSVI